MVAGRRTEHKTQGSEKNFSWIRIYGCRPCANLRWGLFHLFSEFQSMVQLILSLMIQVEVVFIYCKVSFFSSIAVSPPPLSSSSATGCAARRSLSREGCRPWALSGALSEARHLRGTLSRVREDSCSSPGFLMANVQLDIFSADLQMFFILSRKLSAGLGTDISAGHVFTFSILFSKTLGLWALFYLK